MQSPRTFGDLLTEHDSCIKRLDRQSEAVDEIMAHHILWRGQGNGRPGTWHMTEAQLQNLLDQAYTQGVLDAQTGRV